jgi:hypothetical protein
MARPSNLLPPRQTAPLESVVIPSPPPKAPRSTSNNIQVCIRIRPLLPSDSTSSSRPTTAKSVRHASGLITPGSTECSSRQQEAAWLSPTPFTVLQNPNAKQDNSMSGKQDVAYTFDRVFHAESTNGEVYGHCVRDVVCSCVEGFHGSVFAYGQVSFAWLDWSVKLVQYLLVSDLELQKERVKLFRWHFIYVIEYICNSFNSSNTTYFHFITSQYRQTRAKPTQWQGHAKTTKTVSYVSP